MTVQYEMITHPNAYHNDHWAIKILEGDYEGVAYQYDTVSFSQEENQDVVLSFNTITLENPTDADLTSESFESTIGEILTEIIEEHLKELEANEQNGTGDTEASG